MSSASRARTIAAASRLTRPTPITTASGRCSGIGSISRSVGAVDAEQHDHEQEQHDDRAGVDDDLHGGEEVGVLSATNSTATPNSVSTRPSAAWTGLFMRDHADGAAEDHDGGGEEHQVFEERGDRSSGHHPGALRIVGRSRSVCRAPGARTP